MSAALRLIVGRRAERGTCQEWCLDTQGRSCEAIAAGYTHCSRVFGIDIGVCVFVCFFRYAKWHGSHGIGGRPPAGLGTCDKLRRRRRRRRVACVPTLPSTMLTSLSHFVGQRNASVRVRIRRVIFDACEKRIMFIQTQADRSGVA